MAMKTNHKYHPTESKYKGGAQEMYVTYDLKQKTRSGDSKLYPKVKRVYIAGDVKDWKTGNIKKRTSRTVHGVAIEYEQTRKGYRRSGAAQPSTVKPTSQRFRQVVEVPKDAQNIHFYKSAQKLPSKYRSALQNVR